MKFDISEAIANVFNGYLADGASVLPMPLSFTKRADVRAAFTRTTAKICNDLEHAGLELDSATLTSLIFKLGAHCSRIGWQSVDTIGCLSDASSSIIDAIIEKPSALFEPINLNGMLKAHAMRSAQRAAKLVTQRRTDEPTVLAVLGMNSSYVLVELTAPHHLQQESGVLGHCVGTSFNSKALEAKGITESDPEAAQYLHYAIKIQQRAARIFSLRHNGRPTATIEYDCLTQSIVQIEGKPRAIRESDPYFAALCAALHSLCKVIPVNAISGLPTVPVNHVLKSDGRFVVFDAAHFDLGRADEILLGVVTADADMAAPLLTALAACSRLTLDVTQLDMLRLPSIISAHLISSLSSFNAPLLQECGRIDARAASSFSIPLLQNSGFIDAPAATSFSAPLLQNYGSIYADAATSFSVPLLKNCGNISARTASSFSVPLLKYCGNVSARAATSFSVPLLQKCENMDARAATSFSAPVLRNSGNIDVRAANSFSVPLLQECENIYAPAATSFSVPLLQNSGSIYADAATSFNAPLLQNSGIIDAPAATSFSVPLLQNSGSIYADVATSFSVPLLQNCGNIYAHAATSFSAPMLQESGYIETPAIASYTVPTAAIRLAAFPGMQHL